MSDRLANAIADVMVGAVLAGAHAGPIAAALDVAFWRVFVVSACVFVMVTWAVRGGSSQ